MEVVGAGGSDDGPVAAAVVMAVGCRRCLDRCLLGRLEEFVDEVIMTQSD